MHLYLRFNLTYIDTQAFIPIPVPLAAREEVSGNAGRLWNSFMKYDTQPKWFTLHPWALYFLEISRVAFVRSQENGEPLSTQYLVVAIYFLHPADNKLRQYFLHRTPNYNFAIELQGWSCMQERFLIGFRISWTSSRELKYILCVYNETDNKRY